MDPLIADCYSKMTRAAWLCCCCCCNGTRMRYIDKEDVWRQGVDGYGCGVPRVPVAVKKVEWPGGSV